MNGDDLLNSSNNMAGRKKGNDFPALNLPVAPEARQD
jgi:hypothetical protein